MASEIGYLQLRASGIKSSLYFQALELFVKKVKVSLQYTLLNTRDHKLKNRNRTFTVSQKIHALKIK